MSLRDFTVIAYLLHVDAMTCAAKDETGLHCARESLSLANISEQTCRHFPLLHT